MVEYKEVKTKKGKTLVFCKMDELLMEAYGVNTIEEVKRFAKANEKGWVYQIHCPFCKAEGHTKHKLDILDDLSYGHCFVCDRTYVNVTDDITFEQNLQDYNYGFHPNLEVVPLTDPIWTLEKYEYECDDYDQRGVEYLIGRHKYMKDLYPMLGFRFLDGNVVMPFRYKGETFYYQIRFSSPSAKIRYFFPPISPKPPYVLEHGEGIRKIIVCEGVYDAISLLIQAPSYIPVAVLGSSISDYQMDFIREYLPEKILVYMDKTDISIRIAERLKSAIDYCPIGVIKSDGEDPEECMKRKMVQRAGSEIGWIK